jgi:parallel beta-helix repeat protein
MPFTDWFRCIPGPVRVRPRPCLEALEDRYALNAGGPLNPLAWLSLAARAELASDRATPSALHAPTAEVRPGQSIQAAVDAAAPGTVILIDPGTYHQTVNVSTPDLFLVGLGGPGGVVLENPGGAGNGINVNPGANGFALFNLSVQDFDDNGVVLTGVQRFLVSGVNAANDGQYGIFPVSSANGLVSRCSASGNSDTGIYVGQSLDVAVLGNVAHDNDNGIEIENSVNALVAANQSVNNTVGILVDLLPDLPVKVGGNTLVAGNVVAFNNHPNPQAPNDVSALEPSGAGIFILGTDGTRVENNLVLGNEIIGVGVASTELLAALGGGPVLGILPNPSFTRVTGNVIFGGGLSIDLGWDGTGIHNVFDNNTYFTSLSLRPFPSGPVGKHP